MGACCVYFALDHVGVWERGHFRVGLQSFVKETPTPPPKKWPREENPFRTSRQLPKFQADKSRVSHRAGNLTVAPIQHNQQSFSLLSLSLTLSFLSLIGSPFFYNDNGPLVNTDYGGGHNTNEPR